MCRSHAEGGRRCDGHSNTALQSAKRAERRYRAHLREEAYARCGAIVDEVIDTTRSMRDAERAYARHGRWLRSLKATADSNDAIAKLRFDRLHDAAITDPARAWVAAALADGAADRSLNEHEIRRAFEDEQPDATARASFAVAYAAVVDARAEDAVAA